MKRIKTIFALLLASVFLLLTACTGNTAQDGTATPPEIQKADIATLKGPTGMGMVQLIDDTDHYAFQILGAPSEIPSLLLTGEVDIAAMPLNLAATLYQKNRDSIQMLAIHTLGVLYIMENGSSIQQLSDLRGKTIHATGQAATPQYVLEFVLRANGLDPEKDVRITWHAEHSELATLAAAGSVDIYMLPEPNVSTVMKQSKAGNTRIALDMTEEWNRALQKDGKTGELAQGCLVVRKAFYQEHPETVSAFLTAYEKSVNFVNNDVDAAGKLIAEKGFIPNAEIAKQAIPNCNIVLIRGVEMRNIAQQNFQALFDANPSAVGGAIPDDNFYIAQ